MGKTVWLDVFCHEPGDGFVAVKIDYEGVRSAREFLMRTVTALRAHRSLPSRPEKLRALFENVEITGGLVSVKAGVSTRAPTELLDETIRSVDAHLPDDVLLVIAMDELPIAIANITATTDRRGSPAAANPARAAPERQPVALDRLRLDRLPSRAAPVRRDRRRDQRSHPPAARSPRAGVSERTRGAAPARDPARGRREGRGRTGRAQRCIPYILHALAHRLHDTGSGRAPPLTSLPRSAISWMTATTAAPLPTCCAPGSPLRRGDPGGREDPRQGRRRGSATTELDADNRLLDDLVDDHYLLERGGICPGATTCCGGSGSTAGGSDDRPNEFAVAVHAVSDVHDLLERLFVAREPTLDAILARVDAAAASVERNHTLLVGPRGAGKTHLISLAYHRINERRGAGGALQVAWLPEDAWTIVSYRHLLTAIAERIEPKLAGGLPRSAAELESVLTAKAADGGPIVVLVENLDRILNALGNEGQQRLRHLLQAERSLLLIATSTRLDRTLSDQASPFYGFFTTTRLEPFDVDEAAAMLTAIARRAMTRTRRVPGRARRVEPGCARSCTSPAGSRGCGRHWRPR